MSLEWCSVTATRARGWPKGYLNGSFLNPIFAVLSLFHHPNHWIFAFQISWGTPAWSAAAVRTIFRAKIASCSWKYYKIGKISKLPSYTVSTKIQKCQPTTAKYHPTPLKMVIFAIKCVPGSSYRLKLVIYPCKNWFLGFFQKIAMFAHFRHF